MKWCGEALFFLGFAVVEGCHGGGMASHHAPGVI
jgi:hypothetical protein